MLTSFQGSFNHNKIFYCRNFNWMGDGGGLFWVCPDNIFRTFHQKLAIISSSLDQGDCKGWNSWKSWKKDVFEILGWNSWKMIAFLVVLRLKSYIFIFDLNLSEYSMHFIPVIALDRFIYVRVEAIQLVYQKNNVLMYFFNL